MEESNANQKVKDGKGLGTAGLIVGIVALVFSFIPCLGMYAIAPALVGLILSAISMKQAGASNSPKGMAIGGLVTSILGLLIACYWLCLVIFGASAVVNEAAKAVEESGLKDSVSKAMEMIQQAMDTTQTH
jgi:hypothetical protein